MIICDVVVADSVHVVVIVESVTVVAVAASASVWLVDLAISTRELLAIRDVEVADLVHVVGIVESSVDVVTASSAACLVDLAEAVVITEEAGVVDCFRSQVKDPAPGSSTIYALYESFRHGE